ncbi:MBL fold metallo-hydrolase [Wenxinia saemankumensis]|nr:MBL fold metallo-hydrolase [Wenxinia saemankumensis]
MLRHLLPAVLLPLPALAQERIPSHCLAFAEGPARLQTAAWTDPVAPDSVRLTYVDHSMVLIQTPSLRAVTDFNGYLGNVDLVPDVVTMNRAHTTHFTRVPDPAIPHVLNGWGEAGAAAAHDLDLGEMRIRNVPTDIRNGRGGRIPDGNSIFLFEAAGLCLGHMGHLHHEPTEEDYAAMGRVDVAMVAVDGGLTLPIEEVIATMERLRASVVIPIHAFGPVPLGRFADGMAEAGFDVVRLEGAELVMSRERLPSRPTVMILEPSFLGE